MGPLKKLLVRITSFEFWPFHLFYIPVYFYYGWLAIKSRSFFFFTASNPSIDFGGMLGEKKSEIFDLIPDSYIPITHLFSPDSKIEDIQSLMSKKNLVFPIVLKPDIGERGWMVEKINDDIQLRDYLEKIQVPFLLQEFIDYTTELGIFYIRYPDRKAGNITSMVIKEFLSITGDGSSKISELLAKNNRAQLQVDWNKRNIQEILDTVPAANQHVTIEEIGNHCRGTTFLNGSLWVDNQLEEKINHVALQIPGFYFGRFDIRCASIESLKKGEAFKILELNGAGSEPAHIYDPEYSIWRAYKSLFWHLRSLQEISQMNKVLGFPYWSFSDGLKRMKAVLISKKSM